MKKTLIITLRVCALLAVAGWFGVAAFRLLHYAICREADARIERLADDEWIVEQLGPKLIAAFDALKEGQTLRADEIDSSPAGSALKDEPFTYLMRGEDRLTVEYGGGFRHYGIEIARLKTDIWILSTYVEDKRPGQSVRAIWKGSPASLELLWSN